MSAGASVTSNTAIPYDDPNILRLMDGTEKDVITLMEQRRHEIGRLKVALKVLSRPRKKMQSSKRR